MNNSIYNTTKLFLEIGSSKLIENIKILLFKKNAIIFDFLDFEKEKPYTEPLLFAYFNLSLFLQVDHYMDLFYC